MFRRLFSSKDGDNPLIKKEGEDITAWDVVVLTFSVFIQEIQFWIRPNFWMALLSIPILTSPGGKAAMYQTVAAGLRDPAMVRVDPRQEMKEGFSKFVYKALLLAAIKWMVFAIILVATWFWANQETWVMRSVSTLGFYGLLMWWLASGYLYPLLVEVPESKVFQICRQAVVLAFQKPFESLVFSIVSTLLHLLGIVLLGPILVVIPSLRSILHLQGYWLLTGQVIPGFMDLVEYTEKYYD